MTIREKAIAYTGGPENIVDFDNNYINSFTDSMMRVLGYNPFNLNLL